jgi:hypothetical protein
MVKVMMNRRIPKPIPRGCPTGPVLTLAVVLTYRLLRSVEATEAHGPDGFNPALCGRVGL